MKYSRGYTKEEAELVVLERVLGGAKTIDEALERVKSCSPEQCRERLEALRRARQEWIDDAVFLVFWEAAIRVANKYGIRGICQADWKIFSSYPREKRLEALGDLFNALENELSYEEASQILEEICKFSRY
jgi:hypothetical protein